MSFKALKVVISTQVIYYAQEPNITKLVALDFFMEIFYSAFSSIKVQTHALRYLHHLSTIFAQGSLLFSVMRSYVVLGVKHGHAR